FQYSDTPIATAAAAARMTKKSHHWMPRIGTCWNRKDDDRCTEIARLSGWIRVVAGVATIVYDPSWVLWGTVIVPTNRPLLYDIVELVASNVAPLRSTIFRTTHQMSCETESRTYALNMMIQPQTHGM